MDMIFMAFAENVIDRVEDRYGRAAGLAVGAALVVIPIAVLIAAAAWYLS
jgi:hypothetical protein